MYSIRSLVVPGTLDFPTDGDRSFSRRPSARLHVPCHPEHTTRPRQRRKIQTVGSNRRSGTSVARHTCNAGSNNCGDGPCRRRCDGDVYGEGVDRTDELYAPPAVSFIIMTSAPLNDIAFFSLLRAVYETVKKKEAERRRDAAANATPDEPRFADVLKEQWEARKREMAAAEKKTG